MLVLHSKTLFSSEVSKALRGFTRAAATARGVETVVSILNIPGQNGMLLYPLPDASPEEFAEARELATAHPVVAGQFLSESGETMLVSIVLESNEPQTISKIEPIFSKLRELKDHSFAGVAAEASFTGSVAIRIETLSGVRREFFQISGLGTIVAVFVAILLFRSPTTTLIVAAGPTTAVIWTLGLMGYLGLDIEGISTPLPTIVFVVAFANAVHLMLDIRRSRRLGEAPIDAARTAVSHLGLACFLTSLTTAIGFGSLMLAETISVQRFGLSAAMGSVLGLAANLTVVPLLASIARRPARRPPPVEDPNAPATGFLAGLSRAFLFVSIPVSILAVLVTAVLAWSATQLKSDIVWTETLPADSEVTLAMDRCDEEFGGAFQSVVVIEWDEEREFVDPEVIEVLQKIESLVDTDPTFDNPLSLLNFLPPRPEDGHPPQLIAQIAGFIPDDVLKRILRPDLRRAVLSMHVPNTGAAATRPAFRRMKQNLRSLESQHPGFQVHLTGSAVVAADNMSSVIGDLVRSLSFASITVFLVLTIALRSLTLGLISIIPNAFPLLLNAGILYWLDKPLQITSVLTFSICLGIAVDDTIHFLIRFRHERRLGRSVRESIVRSFERVGLALLITTAIITGGFAAAMTSAIPGLVFFGGLACTALFAALLGDLVFLPAFLDRIVGKDERLDAREARREAKQAARQIAREGKL